MSYSSYALFKPLLIAISLFVLTMVNTGHSNEVVSNLNSTSLVMQQTK